MFDESFKINVNKNASDEKLISIIKVTHPSLIQPIRIVQDSKKLIFEGDEYIPFPMRISMSNQVEGELPKATITIPNMAKQIVKWIDSTMGARNGRIEVIITRRSSLKRDFFAQFEILDVSINQREIAFSVSVQDNLSKPSIRWVYDSRHAIGLF